MSKLAIVCDVTETHYIMPCKTTEGERDVFKIPRVFTQFDPMANHDGYYQLIRESFQVYERRGVRYAAFSVICLPELKDPRAARSVAVPVAFTVQVPYNRLIGVIEKNIPKTGHYEPLEVRSKARDPFPIPNDGKIHTEEQLLYALEAWVNLTGVGRTGSDGRQIGILFSSFESEFEQAFGKIKNVWLVPHEKLLNFGEETYNAEDFDGMWARFAEQSARVIVRFINNPLAPFADLEG